MDGSGDRHVDWEACADDGCSLQLPWPAGRCPGPPRQARVECSTRRAARRRFNRRSRCIYSTPRYLSESWAYSEKLPSRTRELTVRFKGANFSGDPDFGGATFSGDADFGGATFSGIPYFGEAIFSGNIDFRAATFRGYADFHRATFSGNADFRRGDHPG